MTRRPYLAGLSLKEERWNTHTDLPSVHRGVREREGGRYESGPEKARLRELLLFFFAQLVFPPPAGVLLSAPSRRSVNYTTLNFVSTQGG